MNEATCATCPWWAQYPAGTPLRIAGTEDDSTRYGECRQLPPRWEYPEGGFDPSAFPVTAAACWCGAHPERIGETVERGPD